MASPCEVFIDTDDAVLARSLIDCAVNEAHRIEHKFSRFRTDNIIHTINTSEGQPIRADAETTQLLNFASQCHELSDGLFDITSGILRRAWKFDGSPNIPQAEAIERLLPLIGWDKVSWQPPTITLPAGMEIDLGGIGKEYAVDKALLMLSQQCSSGILVNFGGDLHVSGPRRQNLPWNVGIENTDIMGQAVQELDISRGAITTSGDSQRFLLKDGIRYGHVLNPLTGWPTENAPHSVTVAANNCIEAGILSTLAMLKGKDAKEFLEMQDVQFWLQI